MLDLKFTLSDVTSFLPEICPDFWKVMFGPDLSIRINFLFKTALAASISSNCETLTACKTITASSSWAVLKLVPILYYQGLSSITGALYSFRTKFHSVFSWGGKFLKISEIINVLPWDENMIYDWRRQAILKFLYFSCEKLLMNSF